MVEIKFSMVTGNEDLIPVKAHNTDACFDLYSREEIMLAPEQRVLVKTGVLLGMENGWAALICPRSGNAIKHGVTVLNGPGVIDAGYRDEIRVLLLNFGEEYIHIQRGDKIAQLMFIIVHPIGLVLSQDLGETERGKKGWGSTGTLKNTR
jgi:dUTP pyrophosphatase